RAGELGACALDAPYGDCARTHESVRCCARPRGRSRPLGTSRPGRMPGPKGTALSGSAIWFLGMVHVRWSVCAFVFRAPAPTLLMLFRAVRTSFAMTMLSLSFQIIPNPVEPL